MAKPVVKPVVVTRLAHCTRLLASCMLGACIYLAFLGLTSPWGSMSIQRGMVSGTGQFTLWNITVVPEINGFKLPEKTIGIRADLCSGSSDSNDTGVGGGLLQPRQAAADGDQAKRIKAMCGKFNGMQIFVAQAALIVLLATLFSLVASLSGCLCVDRRVLVGVATSGAAILSALAGFFSIAALVYFMSLSEHKHSSHVGPGAKCIGLLALFAFLACVAELFSEFMSRRVDTATQKVDVDEAVPAEDAC